MTSYAIQNLWTGKIVRAEDGTIITYATEEEAEVEILKFRELDGGVPYAAIRLDSDGISGAEYIKMCLDHGANQ